LLQHFHPPRGDTETLIKGCRKAGFEVPDSVWMKSGRFGKFLCKLLTRKRLDAVGFFQAEAVERILREQFKGKQNHERRLQAILSPSCSLKENMNRN
jgi:hypothetical protein|tara:strand:- start:210 stop:500 length:291 start_codon:yes stop_codon:yes gene_type:complete